MKTICFDLRALQIGHQNRGIGMHIRSILEHLPADGNRYLFYCFDKNNPIKALGIKTVVDYEIINTPTVSTVLDSPKNILGILKLVGHRFGTLKEYQPDVFVQFDFMLGIPAWRKTKKVIIGYDLIPLIMRNEYMPSVTFAWHHAIGKKAKLRAVLRSFYYNFRYRIHYKVFTRADRILCISEASARSFHDLLGIKQSRLAVVHLAPVLAHAKPDARILSKIKKPYVFYIGGTDSRKSLKDIVHAFNIVRGRGDNIALVLAGNEFRKVKEIPDVPGRNAILKSPYRNDILLLGFVSTEEKMALYGAAKAFIFASTFEGFGLPVLEAMSASCPVVSYNNSSIPEVAGDAAILVKTGDIVGIANGILSLNNTTLRNMLIERGIPRARKFSWDAVAAQTLERISE